ncbi:MAG: PQQ-like beta-propeller repeat protein [Fimbriimonadaceae bacterium]|nr:PQQ-like beta-propeller repeat protein [Fimbriimonadaceae bacterium]
MMRLTSLMIALLAAATAWADFDGPAPLAWRWAGSTSVVPGGAPVVEDDVLYVAVGPRIYGIDRATGNQVWRYPAGVPIEANFRLGCVVSGDNIYAVADNRILYAVNKVTGQLAWQGNLMDQATGNPALLDNKVIVPVVGNKVQGFNKADGANLWADPMTMAGGIPGQIVGHRNSIIYINDAGDLKSVDMTSMREDFSVRLQSFSRSVAPVLVDDNIFINSGTYVIAIRAASGRPAWQFNTNTRLAFAPAVNDEYVASVGLNGEVFVINRRNGTQVSGKSFVLNKQPATSPAFVGTTLVVNTADGNINVVDPVIKEVLFSYRAVSLVGRTRTEEGTGPGGGAGPGRGSGGGSGQAGEGGSGGRTGGAQDPAEDTGPDWIAAAGPAVGAGDSLIVQVRDGSILSFDKNYGVDLTAPSVKMDWPGSGELIWGRPPLNFKWTLEDFGSGINPDTVGVTINGKQMEVIFQPNGELFVVISTTGNNRPLQNGRQEIVVTAKDWLGNEAKKTFVVVVDNNIAPPSGSSTTGAGGPGSGAGGGPGRGSGG